MAKAARKRDSIDAVQAKQWEDAIDALSKEDHYMLPGFDSGIAVAGQEHRIRDIILYLAIAIVIAIVIYAVYTSH